MNYSNKPANFYVRPHFLKHELECRHCGICNISEQALDKLENLRILLGKSVTLNDAARCPAHNKAVGGVPKSQHVSTTTQESCAFDIHCLPQFQAELIAAARDVGFKGIGVYDNFVHIDDRPRAANWDDRTKSH